MLAAQEDLAAAVEEVAQALLRQAGVAGPPIDALAVAAALGCTIVWNQRQEPRASLVRRPAAQGRPSQATIVLTPDARPERCQWAVAHELGEQQAAAVFARLGVDPREAPQAREQIANQLAGAVLLPGEWFFADGLACEWRLPELKARYVTASHELIARRMLQAPTAAAITIFDQGRATFRRGNRGHVGPLSVEERTAWRRAHESAVTATLSTPHGWLYAWPIHEPLWKREILRTPLCDED